MYCTNTSMQWLHATINPFCSRQWYVHHCAWQRWRAMQKCMVCCKFFYNHKELIHCGCYGNGKVGFKNSLGKSFWLKTGMWSSSFCAQSSQLATVSKNPKNKPCLFAHWMYLLVMQLLEGELMNGFSLVLGNSSGSQPYWCVVIDSWRYPIRWLCTLTTTNEGNIDSSGYSKKKVQQY